METRSKKLSENENLSQNGGNLGDQERMGQRASAYLWYLDERLVEEYGETI